MVDRKRRRYRYEGATGLRGQDSGNKQATGGIARRQRKYEKARKEQTTMGLQLVVVVMVAFVDDEVERKRRRGRRGFSWGGGPLIVSSSAGGRAGRGQAGLTH